MKFLDRKEQVLELQMTQYGKGLMSRGKFKPMYYAFFDDDIIYDSEYMSTGGDTTVSSTSLENSVTTSNRIRNAVRTEPQYNYAGVETQINQTQFDLVSALITGFGQTGEEYQLEQLSKPPNAVDSYYSLGLPMGTSEYNSSKAPSWRLNLHKGEIEDLSSGIQFYTGSSGLLKIPQVEVEAVYELFIKSAPPPPVSEATSDKVLTYFSDGSYIKLERDHIIVDLEELNSLFENENCEIEVYEIVERLALIGGGTDIGIQEHLQPLYFLKSNQINNSLYDQANIPLQESQVTESNVEYYFEITVDNEIQDEISISTDSSVYDTPPNDEEPC